MDAAVQQVTARFDAAHDSVVRTSVVNMAAPTTRLPPVAVSQTPAGPEQDGLAVTRPDVVREIEALEQACAEELMKCKNEKDLSLR